MNDVQINRLKKDLADLEQFTLEKDKTYCEEDIIDWISKCTNTFYNIGVESVIVEHFLNYFNFSFTKIPIQESSIIIGNEKDEFAEVKNIGPFQEEISYLYTGWGQNHSGTGTFKLKGSLYYVKIAFSYAENILRQEIESKKIVPVWLIDFLKDKNEFSNIESSLNLIEKSYQDRDTDGMLRNSIGLLENILDLEESLKSNLEESSKLKTLKQKLTSLTNDPIIQNKFGVNKEIIHALNNSRLFRNIKSAHKTLPINYDVPFWVAASTAYLVILFFEITISTGEIIK